MSIFNGFGSIDDVFSEFDVAVEDQEGIEIIYANYNREAYEGDAFMLFSSWWKVVQM